MKKTLIILLGLTAILVTYLSHIGKNMQIIATEIEIEAPPEKVWAVLMDFESWEDWSPIIRKSSGSAAIGNKLKMTMIGKEKDSNGPTYSPVIKDMKEANYFRWRAHMMAGFIMTNDKIFELEKTSKGTKLIHKEGFKGLLAPIFCSQMEKSVPPMLNSMNKALKGLIEKNN